MIGERLLCSSVCTRVLNLTGGIGPSSSRREQRLYHAMGMRHRFRCISVADVVASFNGSRRYEDFHDQADLDVYRNLVMIEHGRQKTDSRGRRMPPGNLSAQVMLDLHSGYADQWPDELRALYASLHSSRRKPNRWPRLAGR